MSDETVHDGNSRRLATKQSTSAWLPFSIFIGTTLAVGIPIIMLRRARATAFKMTLDNPSTAPPRRTVSSPSALVQPAPQKSKITSRFRAAPSTSTHPPDLKESSSDWDSNPSLLAAVSRAPSSNVLLAGKALLIATGLVGVGAFGLVIAVQHFTGASTVPEFARRMRYWTDKYLRPITDRIYRPPVNEDERKAAHEVAPPGVGWDEEWTWEEAENRLRKAYDQGGFSLWAQVALRELEAEARVERARRDREVVADATSRSHPLS